MKVYVSGSWSHRQQIAELAGYLERSIPEFHSTSRWLLSTLTEAEVEQIGPNALIDEDYKDVEAANVFLLVNVDGLGSASPGKWIELGYALANGKLCVVWGNFQSSLFLQDKAVIWLSDDSGNDLIRTLNAIRMTLNSLNLGDTSAHRADTGVVERPAGSRPETSSDENRSEAARPGIRQRESSTLRNLIRTIGGRAARPDGR